MAVTATPDRLRGVARVGSVSLAHGLVELATAVVSSPPAKGTDSQTADTPPARRQPAGPRPQKKKKRESQAVTRLTLSLLHDAKSRQTSPAATR
ncbi:MAG: hypothetical protein R6X34_11655 [Chloroflexota bacterium]